MAQLYFCGRFQTMAITIIKAMGFGEHDAKVPYVPVIARSQEA